MTKATQPFSKVQMVFGAVVGTAVYLALLQVLDFPYALDTMAVSFLFTFWLFHGAVHAKGMMERGELDSFSTWMWSPGVVVVLLLDFTWNVLWGSIIFRELPQLHKKEVLFSSRVQRMCDQYEFDREFGTATNKALTKAQQDAALVWAMRLNRIDPGHIRLGENAADAIRIRFGK